MHDSLRDLKPITTSCSPYLSIVLTLSSMLKAQNLQFKTSLNCIVVQYDRLCQPEDSLYKATSVLQHCRSFKLHDSTLVFLAMQEWMLVAF